MLKKTIVLVLAAAMMIACLSGCGEKVQMPAESSPGAATNQAASSGSGKVEPNKDAIQLKVGCWAAEGETVWIGFQKLEELIEKGTNGAIDVIIYGNDQLGSTNEQLEQLALNEIQMTVDGIGGTDALNYLFLPYLFDELDDYVEFFETDLGKQLNEGVLANGYRNIGLFPRNPRIMSCNDRIETLDDFKNVKFRTGNTDYYIDMYKAFGAVPVAMTLSETYGAIQNGIVSGQENPIETIVGYGFHNICKYLIVTNHIVKSSVIHINEEFYQSLTEEQRQVILDACDQVMDVVREALAAEEADLYKQCEDAGMEIIYPDPEPLKEATQQLRDEYGTRAWGAENYEVIKEFAQTH